MLYSVALEPGQALAVRARDGKVLWRKPLDGRAESSPLVLNGRMYFGDEAGELLALDIEDGSTIWETSSAAPSRPHRHSLTASSTSVTTAAT